MKREEWRSMKFTRARREYLEQSARFTEITGSVGYAGLHQCTMAMQEVVANLEQVAADPDADLDSLFHDMERMAECTRMLDEYLGHVANSFVRYTNAVEELAPTCPPPRPRIREEPGSCSRWSRWRGELAAPSVQCGGSGDASVEDSA